MSVSEIERVKQDIATIKEAAGIELPFGWVDVWLCLFGVPTMGIWWLLWLFLSKSRPSPYVMAVPAVLLLAILGYLRFKHRRSTGSSAIKRREYGISFYGSIFFFAAGAVFLTWARRAGMDKASLGSGLVTMCGLMITIMAFQGKQQISNLGVGIPVMLFGISMVIWPSADAVIRNGSIAAIVAGPVIALIMMYQLKQAEQKNDAD